MSETPEARRRIMQMVKGKDTTPELIVRRLLHSGRLLLPPGTPDIVFPARRKAVLVHGCFWHGHDCIRGSRQPKTNTAYWIAKIARNRVRDVKIAAALVEAGWSAFTVWECETKAPEALQSR